MRDQSSVNRNIPSTTVYLSAGRSLERSLLEFHLCLIVASLFLLNGPLLFCYL